MGKRAHTVQNSVQMYNGGNAAVMETLLADEVAVPCWMSFKGLRYSIDRTLVQINAEAGKSSGKKQKTESAVNAQYMCMEYSGLVFVHVGVCGLGHCFILKCLFRHHYTFLFKSYA